MSIKEKNKLKTSFIDFVIPAVIAVIIIFTLFTVFYSVIPLKSVVP